MFGAKLGELDAYAPLPSGSSGFGGIGGGEAASSGLKNHFREALERARREGKLVFVNFTGYACTNCHWMKANMFTRPEILSAMQGFVLVELFTDGTDEPSRLNQEFEEKTFGTVAIPYYAIFTADGKVIASFPGLTRNPQEFLAFLNAPAGIKSAQAITRVQGYAAAVRIVSVNSKRRHDNSNIFQCNVAPILSLFRVVVFHLKIDES